MENYKERLTKTVDYMDEEQCEFVHKLINTLAHEMLGKGDLMELADMKGTGKVDSATPQNYIQRIQEIYPNFKTTFHVFDYRENSYGELNNVAEVIILKANKILQRWPKQ